MTAQTRHSNLRALLAGLFFILLPLIPAAQQDSEDYIIGPKDVLSVGVWGEENLQEEVEVSVDGTIPFFFIGEVKVAGLTVAEARARLQAMLSNGYIKNPLVILKVTAYVSKEVQIQGAIKSPGSYTLKSNYTTLLKLISMAGGTEENRGNYAFITRARPEMPPAPTPDPVAGSTAAPAPADGATAAPEFGWASETKPGDTQRPAEKPAPAPAPAAPAARTAPSGQIAQVVVDLRALLDRGDPTQDVKIYPGDFVLIGSLKAENPASNYVFIEGSVRNPQQLEFSQGMTALQAVIQAGGLTDVASPNRAVLTRIGPDGKPLILRVKLRDIQRGKIPDVPLQPGDRLNVPESIF